MIHPWESNSDGEEEKKVNTFEGKLVEIGTRAVRSVYLYPDRDDGLGLAHKDFTFLGVLEERSTEWGYAREIEETKPDD